MNITLFEEHGEIEIWSVSLSLISDLEIVKYATHWKYDSKYGLFRIIFHHYTV